ncbi:GAP family protein [Urechidicola vernalis]|uniref:GAP family protein n=1 Tax=Urechidicola vernalis TaxID=3075600 RepID=A0ABU2Y6G5_9FLAO|nr:GAP family protein [Urechidicola sp. P050]MDT0553788.1 GAP family protein [Urechidicola sp. P050]
MLIGLALSPLPLIAMFMLLLTPKAKQNSSAFLIGWLVGVYLIAGAVLLLPIPLEATWKSMGSSKNTQIIIGVAMLLAAVIVKIKGTKKTDPIKIPKLFVHIDKFGFKRSISLGFLMCTINVKNLALVVAGAVQIKTALTSDLLDRGIASLLFTVLASSSMIVPVIIYNLSQEKLDTLFLKWRNFLIRNQTSILMMVLSFFGVLLIYMGLSSV